MSDEMRVLVEALRWRELEESARDWRSWAAAAACAALMLASMLVSTAL